MWQRFAVCLLAGLALYGFADLWWALWRLMALTAFGAWCASVWYLWVLLGVALVGWLLWDALWR